jgi:hypothetical protein
VVTAPAPVAVKAPAPVANSKAIGEKIVADRQKAVEKLYPNGVPEEELEVGRYTLRFDIEKDGLLYDAAAKLLSGGNIRTSIGGLVGKTLALPGLGKEVKILAFRYEPVLGGGEEWAVDFELLQNPVPAVALFVGFVSLFGLALAYMTFRSIEKIAEEAPAAVPALGFGLLLVVGAIVFLWKKLFS